MTAPGEVLELFPGGYPVHLDVPQATVQGSGTAMRFELPSQAHNFPLLHHHEHKLVVALAGQLVLRAGGRVLARLEAGQGVVLSPGTAHRIAQHGPMPSMVGVALWPGRVEEAFRAIARDVAVHGFEKPAIVALLARYGVLWDADGAPAHDLEVQPFDRAVLHLPQPFAAAVQDRWREWLAPDN